MLRDIRQNYNQFKLDRNDLINRPILFFDFWLQEAIKLKVNEPTAMTISTAKDGYPDSRIVLLKDLTDEGFIFFTNYISTKGNQILHNDRVALNFFWPEMERQVRVKGTAQKVDEAYSTDYFKSRPRDSQLAAIASEQSKELKSREELDAKFKQLNKALHDKEIEKPAHWGGYIVKPFEIEFWQGRANRLHDRFRYYLQTDGSWLIKRLSP